MDTRARLRAQDGYVQGTVYRQELRQGLLQATFQGGLTTHARPRIVGGPPREEQGYLIPPASLNPAVDSWADRNAVANAVQGRLREQVRQRDIALPVTMEGNLPLSSMASIEHIPVFARAPVVYAKPVGGPIGRDPVRAVLALADFNLPATRETLLLFADNAVDAFKSALEQNKTTNAAFNAAANVAGRFLPVDQAQKVATAIFQSIFPGRSGPNDGVGLAPVVKQAPSSTIPTIVKTPEEIAAAAASAAQAAATAAATAAAEEAQRVRDNAPFRDLYEAAANPIRARPEVDPFAIFDNPAANLAAATVAAPAVPAAADVLPQLPAVPANALPAVDNAAEAAAAAQAEAAAAALANQAAAAAAAAAARPPLAPAPRGRSAGIGPRAGAPSSRRPSPVPPAPVPDAPAAELLVPARDEVADAVGREAAAAQVAQTEAEAVLRTRNEGLQKNISDALERIAAHEGELPGLEKAARAAVAALPARATKATKDAKMAGVQNKRDRIAANRKLIAGWEFNLQNPDTRPNPAPNGPAVEIGFGISAGMEDVSDAEGSGGRIMAIQHVPKVWPKTPATQTQLTTGYGFITSGKRILNDGVTYGEETEASPAKRVRANYDLHSSVTPAERQAAGEPVPQGATPAGRVYLATTTTTPGSAMRVPATPNDIRPRPRGRPRKAAYAPPIHALPPPEVRDPKTALELMLQ